MIGKGKSISHTLASMEYGLNSDKGAEVVFKQHLISNEPLNLAKEFREIQRLNEKCKRNTLSFVISPTIEDGGNLDNKDLRKISRRFMHHLGLGNRQAVSFVHRDKEHLHLHLYVNRIGFNGEAYNDSYIGKRSQYAAKQVAIERGMQTVEQIKELKSIEQKGLRKEIRDAHILTLQQKPRTIDSYIALMKRKKVNVIPSINKSNQLQGFRMEMNGINLRASEIHRSMSGNKIISEIVSNKVGFNVSNLENGINIAGSIVSLGPNILKQLTKTIIRKSINHVLSAGI